MYFCAFILRIKRLCCKILYILQINHERTKNLTVKYLTVNLLWDVYFLG